MGKIQKWVSSIGDQSLSKKKAIVLLIFILVFGFGMRIWALLQESTICRDGTIYVDLTRQWIESGVYPIHYYLPLYPWMMKLLMQFGMNCYAAGVTINLCLGSLLPLVCYGIIRMITVRREIALAGMLLTAVHPIAIELSINVQRDASYLFFIGGAVFCALYAIQYGKWYWWPLCSLFLVLGIFSRYEALELLPLIVLYFLAAAIFRAISWRKALLGFFSWGIGMIIFVAALIWMMDIREQMSWAYKGRIERILKEKM